MDPPESKANVAYFGSARRSLLIAVVAILVLAAGFPSQPQIQVRQDVPNDVEKLIDSTWASFLQVFPVQADCLREPTLLLVTSLADGDASYTRGTGIIRIKIPTSPERFPESLAHELGHHLDESCSFGATYGTNLKTTQGLPLDASWTSAENWREIPAEHFAEAVTEIVIGTRITFDDRIVLQPETVRLVAEWGRDR